jgi:tripartite ATP-independent transporter DctP family solute receptor
LIVVATCLGVTTSANAQIVTKYSGIQPIEHPSSYAEKYFGEEVKTLSKGAIKVEVYHNTQLGDAVANVQSVRNGTIGFTTVSASNLNQVLPAMDMYSLPFLFKNEAHFWWFLAQPQAADLVKQLEDKGIKIIGYIDSGSRNFFTQKPVRTPDDLKGQKIRVMASPVMVNTMKALGATGVPVAWAELYTALQTGVVDGAENNHPSVVEVNDIEALKAKFTEIINPDKAPFVKAVSGLVSEEGKRLGVEKEVAFILDTQKNF